MSCRQSNIVSRPSRSPCAVPSTRLLAAAPRSGGAAAYKRVVNRPPVQIGSAFRQRSQKSDVEVSAPSVAERRIPRNTAGGRRDHHRCVASAGSGERWSLKVRNDGSRNGGFPSRRVASAIGPLAVRSSGKDVIKPGGSGSCSSGWIKCEVLRWDQGSGLRSPRDFTVRTLRIGTSAPAHSAGIRYREPSDLSEIGRGSELEWPPG